MHKCIRSILFWTNPQTRQWCQNSANKMIIGSGTPSSQSKAPLPKPIVVSHVSRMNLTRTPFVSSSAQIASRKPARVNGPRAHNFSTAVFTGTAALDRIFGKDSRTRPRTCAPPDGRGADPHIASLFLINNRPFLCGRGWCLRGLTIANPS